MPPSLPPSSPPISNWNAGITINAISSAIVIPSNAIIRSEITPRIVPTTPENGLYNLFAVA